jgi:hypothetical protein
MLAELKKLDSLMTRATKQAHRLSISISTAAAHQDVQKGGLGCHSLEVEYNLISHQNSVRALNDEGPRGVITRALFKIQKLGSDALSAEYLPHTLRYGLRLRQLAPLKRCNTRLCCKGIAQDKQQEMNELAATLDAAMPGDTQWDARLVQDLPMLNSIGITAVEDMLTPTRTHVAPASHLLHIVSRRKVQAKHKRAWNRITHYLNTNTPPTHTHTPQPFKQQINVPTIASYTKKFWKAVRTCGRLTRWPSPVQSCTYCHPFQLRTQSGRRLPGMR